jgi:hypothetical protein
MNNRFKVVRFEPRFVPERLLGELSELWHLLRAIAAMNACCGLVGSSASIILRLVQRRRTRTWTACWSSAVTRP